MKQVRKFLYWLSDAKTKIAAVAIVLLLAFFDFLAMYNLFTELDLADTLWIGGQSYNISEIIIYSLMMTILLEGNPFFLGMEVSVLTDKTRYKVNDKINAIIGFIISLAGLLLSFALVMMIRYFLIIDNGGMDAFFKTHNYGGSEDSNITFIAQFCLFWSPILTSMLAFVASLVAFKSESAEKLEQRIEKQHKKFLNAQSEFLYTLNKNDDAKTALWTSLNDRQNGRIPSNFDDFRKECFDRIRAKLIENCIIQYPGQISEFNKKIESTLTGYIEQMSKKTTVPLEIQGIRLEDVIKEYDRSQEKCGRAIDAWSYNIAGDELEKELMKLLDNAVIVAQFKTAEKPYHMEGDF